MELFKLLGRIVVDNEDANKALKQTSDTAEETHSKFSGAMSKIGSAAKIAGATVIAGIGSAVTAVAGLGKAAISSYADYEQLCGGVETLFGAGGQSIEEYAESVGKSVDEARDDYNRLMSAQNKVFGYAKTAYKDAGMSANEYMETVTGFAASLVASLGGDTEAAAEKANMALVDMSDNANKMGSDMESIKNAYQGFAKQNYTMLDNLKLGFGGTKEEMQRLIATAAQMTEVQEQLGITVDASSMSYDNIVNAIHVVQTEMGITGTTAKEAASTISGSIGMMKSSWQNLLTGFADGNQDMTELIAELWSSIEAVADNVLPRIQETMAGISRFVVRAVPMLLKKIPPMLGQILPQMMSASMTLLQTVIKTLIEALPSLLSELSGAITSVISNAVSNVSGALGGVFSSSFTSYLSYFQMAFGNLSEMLMQSVIPMFTAQFEGLKIIFADVYNAMLPVIEMIGMLTGDIVLNAIEFTSSVVIPVITDVVTAFTQIANTIITAVTPAITQICDAFNTLQSIINEAISDYIIPTLQMFIDMIEQLWIENQDKITAVGELFKTVFNDIAMVVQWFVGVVEQYIYPLFINLVNWTQENMSQIKAIFQSVFDIIGGIVNAFTAMFKGDWSGTWEGIKQIMSGAVGVIKNLFILLNDFFQSIWNKINSMMSSAVNRVKDTLVNTFTTIKNKVAEIFKGMWDGIKSVLNSIIGGVEGMVNGVIRGINKLIDGLNTVVEGAGDLLGLNWSVKALDTVSLPRLEKGGILEKGQVGLLEGNGAEAVVPLENNKKWIKAVADSMREENSTLSDKMAEKMIDLLQQLVDSNSELYDNIASLKFEVGHREFARLVRSV